MFGKKKKEAKSSKETKEDQNPMEKLLGLTKKDGEEIQKIVQEIVDKTNTDKDYNIGHGLAEIVLRLKKKGPTAIALAAGAYGYLTSGNTTSDILMHSIQKALQEIIGDKGTGVVTLVSPNDMEGIKDALLKMMHGQKEDKPGCSSSRISKYFNPGEDASNN